jgi:hypothetical protein
MAVTFGQRIRELRKAMGLGQRAVANEIGINFTYWRKRFPTKSADESWSGPKSSGSSPNSMTRLSTASWKRSSCRDDFACMTLKPLRCRSRKAHFRSSWRPNTGARSLGMGRSTRNTPGISRPSFLFAPPKISVGCVVIAHGASRTALGHGRREEGKSSTS